MSKSFHIWSFDPGLATGWSHLTFEDGVLWRKECGETDHFGLGDMLQEMEPHWWTPDRSLPSESVFVSESFTITQKKSPAPWSLESIGLIRYWAHKYNIPFELVAPSQHKGLISDSTIKRADLWVPGKGHAMDAVRVGLFYAVVKLQLMHDCLVVDNE